ncbi:VIT1/CCC1 transporter family protein [Schaalia vaccimaxillae]|uniref:VIT1/CCC1 transporter family protein n=1 Tax=Schaalia vaccimaxillae TaxID=183916 RepID=UPI0003B57143|nr:VIT family protein [Schaalia vaccimaxillae]
MTTCAQHLSTVEVGQSTPTRSHPAEQSLASRLNWLRAGVLGANDGIVSISGLLIGVAAVDSTDTRAILIAGVAGIVSAALSMAVGEYVSVSAQRDAEREVVARKTRELTVNPQAAQKRLANAWIQRGLTQETADLVAQELSQADPLRAHLEIEHRIDSDDLTSPWAAAISSFLAFVIGAALPLLTILVSPPPLRIIATIGAVIVALALTGWVSAALGQAPRTRAVLRLVVGGGAAMVLAYGVGHLFGVAV